MADTDKSLPANDGSGAGTDPAVERSGQGEAKQPAQTPGPATGGDGSKGAGGGDGFGTGS